MTSSDAHPELFRRLLLRLANLHRDEAMIKRGKTHSVVEIPRPWPRRVSWKPGLYWPSMIIMWRKRDRISFTVYPWLNLRRWLFSRCEYCGRRFPYGSGAVVHQAAHMHSPRSKSIALGETGLYHMDCPLEPRAEHGASDGWDRSYGHQENMRREILNEPVWIALELAPLAQARRDAEDAYRRRLRETRIEAGLPEFVWTFPKAKETTGV